MDRHKLILLFHTLKFLRYKQVYYRLFYLIRNKFFKRNYLGVPPIENPTLIWEGGIPNPMSYIDGNSFRFLNLKKDFKESIDWNFNGYGKLWTYNLNYFDFLHQNQIAKKEGLNLIENYIEDYASIKEGIDSYPISLRGMNWIKFLSKHGVHKNGINVKLYHHYLRLKDNLEYDLLGNHLLENGYSLLFGAYYFQDHSFYNMAQQILEEELEEQILGDGAHFELSPMYHQILLHRLLDCINLIRSNPWKKDGLHRFLVDKARKMLGWLQAITFESGNIPMVNDSAYDIAPLSEQLFRYAQQLKLPFKATTLKESGYRKFLREHYELFVDVGNIGPDYQPGHAHSDTFSFELYIKKSPFIVEVGTSTYQKDGKRQKERQTYSHNTVMVNRMDQSQVWSGFRVGKRAKIVHLEENANRVSAVHNGYKAIGALHKRDFFADEHIIILDKVLSKNGLLHESQAFFHFHPSLKNITINKNQVSFSGINVSLNFEGRIKSIDLERYEYAKGFNKTEVGQKVSVSFITELKTTIQL